MRCDNGMSTMFYKPEELECISASEQESIKQQVLPCYQKCKRIMSFLKSPDFYKFLNLIYWLRRMANRKDWSRYVGNYSFIAYAIRNYNVNNVLRNKFNAIHSCDRIIDIYDHYLARGIRLNRAQYKILQNALRECVIYLPNFYNSLLAVEDWYRRNAQFLEQAKRKFELQVMMRYQGQGSRCGGGLIPGTRCLAHLPIMHRIKTFNPSDYCIDEAKKFLKVSVITPNTKGLEHYKRISVYEALRLLNSMRNYANRYGKILHEGYGVGLLNTSFGKRFLDNGIDVLIKNKDKLGLGNILVDKLNRLKKSVAEINSQYESVKGLRNIYSTINSYIYELENYTKYPKRSCISKRRAEIMQEELNKLVKLVNTFESIERKLELDVGKKYLRFFLRLLNNGGLYSYIREGKFDKARELLESDIDFCVKKCGLNKTGLLKPVHIVTIKPAPKPAPKPILKPAPKSAPAPKHISSTPNVVTAFSVRAGSTQSNQKEEVKNKLFKYAPYILAGGAALLLLSNRD